MITLTGEITMPTSRYISAAALAALLAVTFLSSAPTPARAQDAEWCVITREVRLSPGQTNREQAVARCADVATVGEGWTTLQSFADFAAAAALRDSLDAQNVATNWCVLERFTGEQRQRTVVNCADIAGAGEGWTPVKSNLTFKDAEAERDSILTADASDAATTPAATNGDTGTAVASAPRVRRAAAVPVAAAQQPVDAIPAALPQPQQPADDGGVDANQVIAALVDALANRQQDPGPQDPPNQGGQNQPGPNQGGQNQPNGNGPNGNGPNGNGPANGQNPNGPQAGNNPPPLPPPGTKKKNDPSGNGPNGNGPANGQNPNGAQAGNNPPPGTKKNDPNGNGPKGNGPANGQNPNGQQAGNNPPPLPPPGTKKKDPNGNGPNGNTADPTGPKGKTTDPTGPKGKTADPTDPKGKPADPTDPKGKTAEPLNPTGKKKDDPTTTAEPSGPKGKTAETVNPTAKKKDEPTKTASLSSTDTADPAKKKSEPKTAAADPKNSGAAAAAPPATKTKTGNNTGTHVDCAKNPSQCQHDSPAPGPQLAAVPVDPPVIYSPPAIVVPPPVIYRGPMSPTHLTPSGPGTVHSNPGHPNPTHPTPAITSVPQSGTHTKIASVTPTHTPTHTKQGNASNGRHVNVGQRWTGRVHPSVRHTYGLNRQRFAARSHAAAPRRQAFVHRQAFAPRQSFARSFGGGHSFGGRGGGRRR
jgi:hypothetical protein